MVTRTVLPFIVLTVGSGLNFAAVASPLRDAVAVWHMSEGDTAAGKSGSLGVEGSVKLGVELTGAAREASLRRGGDGPVARFDGGYLRAAIPAGRPQSLRGKEMTLYLRLQDPAGSWAAPLFSKQAPGDEYANILFAHDGWLHHFFVDGVLVDEEWPHGELYEFSSPFLIRTFLALTAHSCTEVVRRQEVVARVGLVLACEL